jgi:AcrR family transcriptional regulator
MAGSHASRPAQAAATSARERIVSTAYELFARHGLHAVGVQQIIDEAEVAKATLYRHFPSKEDLVVAVLDRRRELWTREWLVPVTARAAGTAEDRLLAVFDAFDEWFRAPGFEGCLLMNLLIETHDPTSAIARAAVAGIDEVRDWLRLVAREAGHRDPDATAGRIHLLMSGSIVAAVEGKLDAAREAREMAVLVLSAGRAAG